MSEIFRNILVINVQQALIKEDSMGMVFGGQGNALCCRMGHQDREALRLKPLHKFLQTF